MYLTIAVTYQRNLTLRVELVQPLGYGIGVRLFEKRESGMPLDPWNEIPPERREVYELGDAALGWLKQGHSIERWHEAGDALNAMQADAMAAAHTNAPVGKGYNLAYAALADHTVHLRNLDKGTRSNAMWLATNWADVTTWLKTLGVTTRMQLNHPTAIKRRYDAANRVPPVTVEGEGKRASPQRQLKDQLIKVQEENDLLRKKSGGGLLPSATAEELADMIADSHAPVFITKLITALNKRREADARQDRIEAKVAPRGKAPVKVKA